MHQRIEALRQRRSNDRINMILSAAARGDVTTMKEALKVTKSILLLMNILWHLDIKVQKFKLQGENVNIHDSLKRTPLHVASSQGQVCTN